MLSNGMFVDICLGAIKREKTPQIQQSQKMQILPHKEKHPRKQRKLKLRIPAMLHFQ